VNAQEFRDLLYYLTRPGQAPLVATSKTLSPLFNGHDLGGWAGDPAVWRYDDGEIIGRIDARASSGSEYLIHDVLFADFRLVFRVQVSVERRRWWRALSEPAPRRLRNAGLPSRDRDWSLGSSSTKKGDQAGCWIRAVDGHVRSG
jgi:hypothetical protein